MIIYFEIPLLLAFLASALCSSSISSSSRFLRDDFDLLLFFFSSSSLNYLVIKIPKNSSIKPKFVFIFIFLLPSSSLLFLLQIIIIIRYFKSFCSCIEFDFLVLKKYVMKTINLSGQTFSFFLPPSWFGFFVGTILNTIITTFWFSRSVKCSTTFVTTLSTTFSDSPGQHTLTIDFIIYLFLTQQLGKNRCIID